MIGASCLLGAFERVFVCFLHVVVSLGVRVSECMCGWASVLLLQAEGGIRDLVRSRGLGDVYKRQGSGISEFVTDDVNGFLADDDEELVRRLTTLAVHPSVRSRMTAYNLKNEPTQSWDNVVQTAESEYARALALAG